MHYSIELLDEALAAAKALGFGIRREWLDGQGGGRCDFGGKKWFFLDLSQSNTEQLAALLEVLREEPRLLQLSLSPELTRLLGIGLRQAA
jgi:hypothetical protein